MECLVLAGGRPQPPDPLYADTRGRQKAALDLAGRPMIAWVLDALQGSRHLDGIILVGLDDDLPVDGLVTRVPDQGSLADNLYAGIARLSGDGPAASCWSDIPLATPAMIDRFIDGVADPGLDVDGPGHLALCRQALAGRCPAP